jgi:uncharacterized membrane protein YuzA (DUF378 family)
MFGTFWKGRNKHKSRIELRNWNKSIIEHLNLVTVAFGYLSLLLYLVCGVCMIECRCYMTLTTTDKSRSQKNGHYSEYATPTDPYQERLLCENMIKWLWQLLQQHPSLLLSVSACPFQYHLRPRPSF